MLRAREGWDRGRGLAWAGMRAGAAGGAQGALGGKGRGLSHAWGWPGDGGTHLHSGHCMGRGAHTSAHSSRHSRHATWPQGPPTGSNSSSQLRGAGWGAVRGGGQSGAGGGAGRVMWRARWRAARACAARGAGAAVECWQLAIGGGAARGGLRCVAGLGGGAGWGEVRPPGGVAPYRALGLKGGGLQAAQPLRGRLLGASGIGFGGRFVVMAALGRGWRGRVSRRAWGGRAALGLARRRHRHVLRHCGAHGCCSPPVWGSALDCGFVIREGSACRGLVATRWFVGCAENSGIQRARS